MRFLRPVSLLLALLWIAGCAPKVSTPKQSQLVRVLVYNIHAGKDAKQVDNLDRVAALIKEQNADIVLLQEVDKFTQRSGKVDQLAKLEQLTGMKGTFGKSLDYQGGDYGIAILSRWPITTSQTTSLKVEPAQTRAGGSKEPRVALTAVTQSPFGDLIIINTHIDAGREDTYRKQEAPQVVSLAREALSRGARVLVGGDFNSTPESDVQQTVRSMGMRDAWMECGSGDGFTYPDEVPVKRIDYLYLTGKLSCTGAQVLDSHASDHRAIVFIVKLN